MKSITTYINEKLILTKNINNKNEDILYNIIELMESYDKHYVTLANNLLYSDPDMYVKVPNERGWIDKSWILNGFWLCKNDKLCLFIYNIDNDKENKFEITYDEWYKYIDEKQTNLIYDYLEKKLKNNK
jgi:hypothetical protein